MEWSTVQHLDLRHIRRGLKPSQPHAAASIPIRRLSPRLSEPMSSDELANDILIDDGNQINTLRKTIAYKIARDHNMLEIP